MKESLVITPHDIWVAAERLGRILPPTPLVRSRQLEEITGKPHYLKVESMQPTGSFKVRGALNRLLSLRGARSIVTASSGNHGAAVAWAAARLGISASVVVPETTPETKLQNIAGRGAGITLYGDIYDEAEEYARYTAAENGAMYVSAFADSMVMAGQGSLVLELTEQSELMGTLVVPVGGGGLISGVAVAAKGVSSQVRVIGVQPAASCPMYRSFEAGHMVTTDHHPTLSDATAGDIAEETLQIVMRHVDHMVTVTEEEIARAIRYLLLNEHLVAEGAGALATAAVLSGRLPPDTPTPIILVLSGHNIDEVHLVRAVTS